MKHQKIANRMIFYFFLIILLFFVLFPFLQMLSTALKGPTEQFATPVHFIPKHFTLINFKQAMAHKEFLRYFLNSLGVSIVTTCLAVFIGLLAAYGFTRTRFPGRKLLLNVVLFSQMFCLSAIAVPIYRILAGLHLINTFYGLILSYLTFTVPVAVWLMRSFLLNIPLELEEAAITEGASKLGAFWKVVVPLMRPAIGAVGAYVFFQAWQEYLFALIIMTNNELRTLPIGIMDFVGQYGTNWGNLMAASIILAVPVFILFMFVQRELIAGLTEGAVKG